MCHSITAAITAAQDIIWGKGLLNKENSLLHGPAGNSLALLDQRKQATFLARYTDEVTQVGLADGSIEPSSTPSAYQNGLLGVIWVMCEYHRGRSGIVAGYNDV